MAPESPECHRSGRKPGLIRGLKRSSGIWGIKANPVGPLCQQLLKLRGTQRVSAPVINRPRAFWPIQNLARNGSWFSQASEQQSNTSNVCVTRRVDVEKPDALPVAALDPHHRLLSRARERARARGAGASSEPRPRRGLGSIPKLERIDRPGSVPDSCRYILCCLGGGGVI